MPKGSEMPMATTPIQTDNMKPPKRRLSTPWIPTGMIPCSPCATGPAAKTQHRMGSVPMTGDRTLSTA